MDAHLAIHSYIPPSQVQLTQVLVHWRSLSGTMELVVFRCATPSAVLHVVVVLCSARDEDERLNRFAAPVPDLKATPGLKMCVSLNTLEA